MIPEHPQARQPLLRVAVPTPLRRYFDYLPPAAGPAPRIGSRVRVPFGRAASTVGVIVAFPEATEVAPARLRRASEVIDAEPLLEASLVRLLRWAADYYHHAPGEVFAAALPGMLRRGQTPSRTALQSWQLSAAGRDSDPQAVARRAPRQASLIETLAAAGAPLTPDALEQALGPGWRPVLRRLLERGLVEEAAPAATRDPGDMSADETSAPGATTAAPPDSGGPCPLQGSAGSSGEIRTVTPEPELTPDQAAAVGHIEAALGGFDAFLLHGVTGSGKTEVYLRTIRRVVADGGQALVLVPEIGLTPQLVSRLAERLHTPIATLHSGMAEAARARAFLDAREGRAGVVLGTRSGVFAPLHSPGLIVVDEEHDTSLKQQDGFRYHARDVAVYRARALGVPVVLGSATPSLESLWNAERGRYRLLHLPTRAGSGVPPRVRLVDLRRDPARGGLSGLLVERMRAHLAAGAQVLLFLNRRGFAPVWLCLECGWIAHCPRCDARLTYHRGAGRLTCHHCGHERPAAASCPECGSAPRPVGEGTEQVEEALAEQFPDVPAARIDRDSIRRRGELERHLAQIRAGNTRILIGTQMLTKGHDFPGVTLVGVLNADGGLFGSDFRAPERLAQLIVQVAGRAGRAGSGGEVLVQTSFPEHPLLYTLLREGYDGFARAATAEREAAGWPPFSALAMLRAEAPKAGEAVAFLAGARARAEQALRDLGTAAQVLLLGPAPAPMERRAGRYRAQLLLQAGNRGPLHRLLARLLPQLEGSREARRVRWSVDVDPAELD